MIRQTKTTLRELTAQYRGVLRHAFLTSIAVMGVALATPASADITVDVGGTPTNIETQVITAVAGSDTVMNAAVAAAAASDTVMNAAVAAAVTNANTATADGSYYGQTWDSTYHQFVHATDTTTAAAASAGAAPDADDYSLTLNVGGSTNLDAYTGGYVITDPEADPAAYSIKETPTKIAAYTFTKTKPDNSTEVLALSSSDVSDTPVYATTGYDYAVTTAYRVAGDSTANVSSQPQYSDYQFSDGTTDLNLADYIDGEGNLVLPPALLSNITAATNAGNALAAYGDDTTAYTTMKGRYDTTNAAYGAAVANVNADQNAINAAIAEYRDDYGEWKAADTTYSHYTTADAAKTNYENSLAYVINDKATTAANATIATAVATSEQNAKDYADGLAGNYDAAGSAAAETARATGVESGLQSAIDTLNADENTAGSVAKSVKDATTTTAAGNYYASGASVLTAVAGVDGQTKTNTDAIATLNADENTAGSVAKSVKDATTTTAAGNYYASGASVLTAIAGVDGQTKTNTDGISTLNTALTAETANRAAADQYILDKMDGLEDNMSAGVASAVALSSVAVSNVRRGEVSVGGGYGYYNDQSALALGAAMGLSDRWSVNAGAGLGLKGSDNFSVRAGTNYKFKLF